MKPVKEASKEIGRVVFFGAVSALIAYGTTKLSGLDPNSTTVIVGTLVLRFVDSWVHNNDNIKANGIAPF